MSDEVFKNTGNFGANYTNANRAKAAIPYDSGRMLGYISALEKLDGGKLKQVAPAVVAAMLIAQRRADCIQLLFRDFTKGMTKDEGLKVFLAIREGINTIIAFVGIPTCIPACFGLVAELHAQGIEVPKSSIRGSQQEVDWHQKGEETSEAIYKLVGNTEVRWMLDRIFNDLYHFATASAFGYMIAGTLAVQTLGETEITLASAIIAMGATRQARSHCKAAIGVGNSVESVEKIVAIAHEIASWNGTPLDGEIDVLSLAAEVEANRAKLKAGN